MVLVCGLLAMAVHRPFLDARWAWLEAVPGLVRFEGTLIGVVSNARRGAEPSARTLAGEGDPALLAERVRNEWMGLWTVMVLSLANVVLAVWRPRLKPRPIPATRNEGSR